MDRSRRLHGSLRQDQGTGLSLSPLGVIGARLVRPLLPGEDHDPGPRGAPPPRARGGRGARRATATGPSPGRRRSASARAAPGRLQVARPGRRVRLARRPRRARTRSGGAASRMAEQLVDGLGLRAGRRPRRRPSGFATMRRLRLLVACASRSGSACRTPCSRPRAGSRGSPRRPCTCSRSAARCPCCRRWPCPELSADPDRKSESPISSQTGREVGEALLHRRGRARQAFTACFASGTGSPKKAMTASPLNLSTTPPSSITAAEWARQVAVEERRRSARGSSASESFVKPATSLKRIVISRSPPAELEQDRVVLQRLDDRRAPGSGRTCPRASGCAGRRSAGGTTEVPPHVRTTPRNGVKMSMRRPSLEPPDGEGDARRRGPRAGAPGGAPSAGRSPPARTRRAAIVTTSSTIAL